MPPLRTVRIAYLIMALLIGTSSALVSVAHAFAHTPERVEHAHADEADHGHVPIHVDTGQTGGVSPDNDHGHPKLDNAPVHARMSVMLRIAIASVVEAGFTGTIRISPSLETDELPGPAATGPPPQLRAPPQV